MATGTRSRSRGLSRGPDARASAQDPAPGADEAAAHGGATGALQLRTRRGQAGSARLQRLVLVELAVAVVLVGAAVGPLALVPAAVVAVGLVLLAFVRRRGRWLPEWLVIARALRARQRRAASTPVPPGIEPGLAPVVECEPALRTCSFGGRDRRPVGMVGDGTFLSAVVQVESDVTALRAEGGRQPLPVALVRDALEVDGIRLESAQIVLHTQPAPALHLPQHSVAVTNYRPLQEQTGAPAVRIVWVALKLDPELCREAVAARGGGLVGAQKCLARVADHLASRLTGAGFRTTVLDEEELTAALATSACANPLVTAEAGRTETRERRTEESGRSWRCDNRRHTTYWVRRWPHVAGGGASLPQLVGVLTRVPALATTFSLTLWRGERQETALCGHVRVTGRSDDELVAARQALQDAARQAGAQLARLDREQVPGMLATLPLGGAR
ncbi:MULTISPECIES: type VII secretion protein EccE [Streptomyces]|uniref:Type VII secretion protein EccE n=1 Tax=Streptomyces thermoviolaceus subsp. thermoviolaceus TaxID=66860 RepID=A0ABX0YYA3_STRTL|nr:type VII secretion protein EccE [Streptomyces thermoviolaceus]MCM3264567.1 type VII secretion protein EccE [Streptomyces thermoviolaceus]NJP16874.1 type VII secretion protein EccE [Streptomyces thermoviolaceus subsp. thermoviolaceus]WTD47147.1 type VII secretion protein EccE [Streptomyces thermoviolaceus]GHB12018.1 type VII secretion protein EccE [Streptomyces thermoviolaceus subsp. thermoviolaceus]